MKHRIHLASILALAFAATLALPAVRAQDKGDPNAAAATAATSDPATEVDKDTAKKLKAEDNVALIGNRNVGGGLDFYSQQKEIALGASLAAEVEKESIVIKDPVVNEYINRLAQNLVRNSDAKVPFTVRVLQDDSVNAFALPGGFFFVNSGIILSCDEEDELAGAMAHEIAHVAARHGTRNATKGELLQIAEIPAIIAAGPGLAGLGTQAIGDAAIPATFMRFSRGAEQEADWLGVQYLWKSGYDPAGLSRAFEMIESDEKEKPGFMSKMFASHPQTPDRVALTQKEIKTILPPRPSYVITTSDFDMVQARLRALMKSSIEKGIKVPTGPANAAPPPDPGATAPPVIQRKDDTGGPPKSCCLRP